MKDTSMNTNVTICITILDLNDKNTKYKSGASSFTIEEGVKKIYSGTKYTKLSNNERKSLLEKACKNGVKYAIGNDLMKKAFLYDVMGQYKEVFLQDVLVQYQNKYQ